MIKKQGDKWQSRISYESLIMFYSHEIENNAYPKKGELFGRLRSERLRSK